MANARILVGKPEISTTVPAQSADYSVPTPDLASDNDQISRQSNATVLTEYMRQ